MPYRKSRSRRTNKSRQSKTKGLTLIKIGKSPKSGKKYRAYFSNGKTTDFGATGYSDYTKHKDKNRMKRYLSRHRKNENWKNMTSPGALSRWILWNKPSLHASIVDYKKKLKSRSRK